MQWKNIKHMCCMESHRNLGAAAKIERNCGRLKFITFKSEGTRNILFTIVLELPASTASKDKLT